MSEVFSIKEKLGNILYYEKLKNLSPLKIHVIEKGELPNYIVCPKYRKAKEKCDQKMARYRSKADQLEGEIKSLNRDIELMTKDLKKWSKEAKPIFLDRSDVRAVEKQNHAVDMANKLLD